MRQITAFFLTAFIVTISYGNHPGENIDQYMQGQEKYFQAIDLPNAPPFTLTDGAGNAVSLSDFKDKVVILHFVFTNCQDICPLHTSIIADIQKKINITPMKENVQFITITTDPENDTSDVLNKYGQSHNLDPLNWKFLTIPQGAPESTTRELSNAFNVKFEPIEGGQQMHGAVTHIIDKDGRFAAKFHGLEFGRVNLVMYVNGLINNWYATENDHPKSIWEKLIDIFSLNSG